MGAEGIGSMQDKWRVIAKALASRRKGKHNR